MAFYQIDRTKPSAQLPLNTKSSLIAASNQIDQMLAESLNMTEAQAQAQYGIPVELSFAAWKTTLQDAQTALDAVAITNFTTLLG